MADVLPGVVIGLLAGVWVDRLRRRPLMIWTDVGRAVLLASIPLAALIGVLTLGQLLVVVIAAGTLTALFEVASRSYLPTVIGRDELVEGNSKLQASGSVVEVAAFGFAGVLVQVLTAPIAILLDAVSFVISALCLGGIRTPEPPNRASANGNSTWMSIREGLRIVVHDPILRAIAGARATNEFFLFIWVSMLLRLPDPRSADGPDRLRRAVRHRRHLLVLRGAGCRAGRAMARSRSDPDTLDSSSRRRRC